MPQAAVKNGPQLGIRLGRTDHTYLPGETITGHVFRQAHAVTSKATLQISLHARSKSRMVVHRGHITSTYRGRFDLVNSADYTQTIFEGPLHITGDGTEKTWPFSIKLPTHVNLSALEPGVTQDQSYLPLDAVNALTHRLPPTFSLESYEYMAGMSAFVEYFLQAELKTTSRGSTNTTDATLPFKMLHLTSELLEVQPRLQISHNTQSISSNSLVGGQASVEPTQQIDELPGSSADQTLTFDVEVHVPTVLQMNSPGTVPFFVRAVPDLTKSSADVQYSAQEIRITRVSISIVARTEVKCQGRRATRQTDNETQINLGAEDAYRQYGSTLVVPWKRPATEELARQGNASPHEEGLSEPLNVGEKIGLRLESKQDLYATFRTYNISHTHHLKWQITVQISGKSFELFGEDVVNILTSPELERSTGWIQPPDEDHLPSFSEDQENLAETEGGRSGNGRQTWLGGVGGLSRLWAF